MTIDSFSKLQETGLFIKIELTHGMNDVFAVAQHKSNVKTTMEIGDSKSYFQCRLQLIGIFHKYNNNNK